MTARIAQTRSSSTPALFSATSLLLAAAVALEVVGVRALAPDAAATSVVASIDGAAIEAPARHLRAASVEVRVLAQADLPAR
jgi:hypothetical protein